MLKYSKTERTNVDATVVRRMMIKMRLDYKLEVVSSNPYFHII